MRRRLSRLQLEVMHVLWEKRRATVADVQQALAGHRPLAYSTLATILRRLEEQGVVKHTAEGRTYVYEPVLEPENVGHSVIGDLVEHVFAGSPADLVSNLLESQQVDEAELSRIRKLIERAESRKSMGESRPGRASSGPALDVPPRSQGAVPGEGRPKGDPRSAAGRKGGQRER